MLQSRRGFTIIELLTVLTIMGVLATIAMPRYSMARDRALAAAMVEDLKNLATAQESFFTNNDDYAGNFASGADLSERGGGGELNFTPSPGDVVSLSYHNGPAGPGWSATVTNPELAGKAISACGIFVGNQSYAPNAEVPREGTPVCY